MATVPQNGTIRSTTIVHAQNLVEQCPIRIFCSYIQFTFTIFDWWYSSINENGDFIKKGPFSLKRRVSHSIMKDTLWDISTETVPCVMPSRFTSADQIHLVGVMIPKGMTVCHSQENLLFACWLHAVVSFLKTHCPLVLYKLYLLH